MNDKMIEERQHYIPQFILKNFSTDKKTINFLPKNDKEQKPEIMPVKDVFMDINLYELDSKNDDNPNRLEKSLWKFERKIADLLKRKIFNKSVIILKKSEDELLKLFFVLMKYRSIRTKEFFDNLDKVDKSWFKKFQPDEDYNTLWKTNLLYFARCRSIKEVDKHKKICKPFKNYLLRDLNGTFLTFVKSSKNIEFVLSDSYPQIDPSGRLYLECITYFTLSPDLMMIMAYECKYYNNYIKTINEKIIPPAILINEFRYNLQEFNEYEVLERNKYAFNNSKIGVVFKERENIGLYIQT